MGKVFNRRTNGIIKFGCRPSKLAVKQVYEIIKLFETNGIKINYTIEKIYTTGDIDKTTPISELEGTDFFTDKIEEALLDGKIDIAIHSAKDLPDVIPTGLKIVAITNSIDPYDALVVRKDLPYKNIDELPLNAKIGVCSLRRKEQLKKYRKDLIICDIRGNIDERIEKLDSSNLDAIVVAAAALIRLGMQNRIVQRIPFEILQPHPLQGCLAVEIRYDDEYLTEIFQ
ncbi:MAG: hydroxymethylbilane synthase [Endomicrobia bacterium]|nr:hydroxymethylbilane synthase [Endomicrobiia bacterium]MDW8056464.1 hydroxymethylbilane synthase [Elusimicrobiota bacterium]